MSDNLTTGTELDMDDDQEDKLDSDMKYSNDDIRRSMGSNNNLMLVQAEIRMMNRFNPNNREHLLPGETTDVEDKQLETDDELSEEF